MFRAERRTDLHVKYPLFFSDFHVKLASLDRFPKNNKISIFMKIHAVGAEMFRAERRTDGSTDMTKPIVSFRKFANVSNL